MKDPIIILHGWVSSGKGVRYDVLKELLENAGYTVFVPDLPGFGENKLNKEALSFDDYIEYVHRYIETTVQKAKQKKTILIGHSFGGRIAIKVASLYPNLVSKLILTGASGIIHPVQSLRKKIVYTATKIMRPVFTIPPFSFFSLFIRKLVYYSVGEMDYYNAGKLAKTFKNIYKVSIAEDLQHVTEPTLLLWGENDTIIPVSDGKFMQEQISHAKLVIIPEASHKLPYENPKIFAKHVLTFLA